MARDWLTDFVDYASYGETTPKIMYWVGVATIAGALRRKVWIEQVYFQWTPNFYLLIVGPPGTVKKSTSVDLGLRLLRKVPDIDFGPQIVTWQQLITHMARCKEEVEIDGNPFEMSCCTIGLSEFGSFFDPLNRELIDNLTDIWDSKIGTIKKETKTMGDDEVVNPWLNILACTTPSWVADNFSTKLIGSGFASRPIFLYAEKPTRNVSYPRLSMPEQSEMRSRESSLVDRLQDFAMLKGEIHLTEEAYAWGNTWYEDYKKSQNLLGNSTEAGFYERRQTHLHKLAMVISVSRGKFPIIDVPELEEADLRLKELDQDVQRIFGFIGQTTISKAAREILETLEKFGKMTKKELFRRYFFRTMSNSDYEQAVASVLASGAAEYVGPLNDLCLQYKEVKNANT